WMTIPSRLRGALTGLSAPALTPSKLPAPAASTSRRVQRIGSPHSQALQFSVPGCPIRPYEHAGRLGIANDFFARRIPAQAASQPQGDIGQMTNRGHSVAAFHVGN